MAEDEVKRCTCYTEEKPWGVGSITKLDPDCPVHGFGSIQTWEQFGRACELVGVTFDQCVAATLTPTDPIHLDDAYAVLDEVVEQLSEAWTELDIDQEQDVNRLLNDYGSVERTRTLIKELVDPR